MPALARAKAAGVPVILVNNTPKDGTEELYLTFVGQDQTEMGRLAGASLLNALKESGRDGGKVAMITGALQQGIAPRRVTGFREAVKGNPKVEIVAVEDARWDTATSERMPASSTHASPPPAASMRSTAWRTTRPSPQSVPPKRPNIAVGGNRKQLLVVGGNCLKEGSESIKAGKMQARSRKSRPISAIRAADVINDHFAARNCRRTCCCRSRQ